MKTIQRISKWSLILVLLLSALGVSAWQGWSWWTWASAAPAPRVTTKKLVKLRIPQGTSAQEIGRDLQAFGVIRSANAWDLWTRYLLLKEPQGGFQAGVYELSPAEPLVETAKKIWQGDVVHLSFTIPEGWSLRQMAVYFEQQGFF